MLYHINQFQYFINISSGGGKYNFFVEISNNVIRFTKNNSYIQSNNIIRFTKNDSYIQSRKGHEIERKPNLSGLEVIFLKAYKLGLFGALK